MSDSLLYIDKTPNVDCERHGISRATRVTFYETDREDYKSPYLCGRCYIDAITAVVKSLGPMAKEMTP